MFSVIIPTRGRAGFLHDAVASVRAQTLAAEIIIVNDGAGPIAEDARIIDNQQRGLSAARNAGVAAAATPFIAFLDDDDRWIDPDHLARAAAALDAGALYFADGVLEFEDGSRPLPFARDADAASLERDNTILVSTVCYCRTLHDALGFYDLDLPYYSDWDWYLRVAHSGTRLHRHPEPAAAIRVHAANMSGDDTAPARQANLDRFAAKHALGPLILKNHVAVAREG